MYNTGVNLKSYNKILKIDKDNGIVDVQAGIGLTVLLEQLEDEGLTL